MRSLSDPDNLENLDISRFLKYLLGFLLLWQNMKNMTFIVADKIKFSL